MLSLVYKEFVQVRQYLLQIAGFLALAAIIIGRTSPGLAMTYFYVFPVVLSVTLPQIIFGQEERGNTFTFLRALPIRPAEIVAAKYFISLLVTVGFLLTIGLAGTFFSMPPEGIMAALSTVGLASLALAGLSFFLHFWLGQRSARVALLMVTFALAVPVMLVYREGGITTSALGQRLAWLEPIATSPAGVALAFGAGLAFFGASFAASSWVFARRDITRLP